MEEIAPILNIPIGFIPDLFSLEEKEREINNLLYHGKFIFNNDVFDYDCKKCRRLTPAKEV